jgi:exopolysaccharide biosynthesis polyprenyl glycosylphosphotransferase
MIPAPPGTLRVAAQVAAFGFPTLIGVRFLVRRLLGLPGLRQRVLVVGTGCLAREVAQAIVERDQLGIEFAGFLSNGDDSAAELPVLGKLHQLEKIAKESQIDRIVVACEDDGSFPVDQLISLKVRGCRVEEAASFFERTTGRVHVRDLQAMDLALSEGFRWGASASLLKRALDIVVASLALVVSAPILALFAVAIRLDSRGPLLFRQTRVGRDNRTFRIVKLRTMRDGAERDTGPVLCTGGDERVTRVGRILRLTRLDEVPQFWNVLVGDMSVVGPRPERPEFVQMLTERYPHFRWRCAVRPGITGWAQVRYGYVNEIAAFEHKLALDLFYLKHRSLAMDCLVLWKTVKTIFLFQGL